MHIRVTRLQVPPESVDKGIAFFKETVVPSVSAAPGCVGQIMLVDRQTGSALGITQWESAQALGASEQAGITARTQSAAATGGRIINVERFENVINERAAAPKSGGAVRINTVAGDPAKLDNAIKFIQKQALSSIQSQPGFQALLMNVDRATGRAMVTTVWDTRANLDASESKVSSLRRDWADAAGAKDATVEVFESAVVNIKQGATA